MKNSLTLDRSPRFDIVYLDPPWDYKGQLQHSKPGMGDTGGARKHYGTLKLKQLKQFPMQQLMNKDSLVFMWVTNPHLDQGIELNVLYILQLNHCVEWSEHLRIHRF